MAVVPDSLPLSKKQNRRVKPMKKIMRSYWPFVCVSLLSARRLPKLR